jgi:hypothetical protein
MTQTTVCANIFQAFNIICYQALEIAFYIVVGVNDFANLCSSASVRSFTRVVGSILAAARMVEACFGPMP